MNHEDPKIWKYDQLRRELRKLGLNIKGKKTTLLRRYLRATNPEDYEPGKKRAKKVETKDNEYAVDTEVWKKIMEPYVLNPGVALLIPEKSGKIFTIPRQEIGLVEDGNVREGIALKDRIQIGKIKNLKRVFISALDGKISSLNGMENCHKLKEIVLRNHSIQDITCLSKLSNLSKIWLQHNNINDLEPLKSLPNLTILDVSHNSISDLSPLSGHKLQYLNVSHNPISSIQSLMQIATIIELSLENIQLTDETLKAFEVYESESLSVLNLDFNPISDLKPISHLVSLRELYICHTKVQTVEAVSEGLIALRQLYVTGCPEIQHHEIKILEEVNGTFVYY